MSSNEAWNWLAIGDDPKLIRYEMVQLVGAFGQLALTTLVMTQISFERRGQSLSDHSPNKKIMDHNNKIVDPLEQLYSYKFTKCVLVSNTFSVRNSSRINYLYYKYRTVSCVRKVSMYHTLVLFQNLQGISFSSFLRICLWRVLFCQFQS